MKKYIIVTADTNDGDYVTQKTEISDERIDKIKDILSHIEHQKGPDGIVYHQINWRTHERADSCLEEQHPELSIHEVNFLNTFCPSAEYGIHTIESIEILNVESEEKLI